MGKWNPLWMGAAGLAAGIVIGSVGVAQALWKADTSWIASGKAISATKLLDLLKEADERLVALETPHATRYEYDALDIAPGPNQLKGQIFKWGESGQLADGLYTCPVDGLYRVSAGLEFNANIPPDGVYVSLNLWKVISPNNAVVGVITSGRHRDSVVRPSGSISTPCAAGDQLFIAADQSNSAGATLTTSANRIYNYTIFERVGPMP